MLKKKILLPMMLVLAIALVGCTTPKDETPPETTPPAVDETPGDETPEETPGDEAVDNDTDVETPEETPSDESSEAKISPEEAYDKYVDKFGDSKVRKIQLDEDNGVYRYKVQGYDANNEYQIKVDSNSGEILKEDTDNDNDDDNVGELSRANVEKIQAIVDKEMSDAGAGAKLSEWTLKAKNGRAMLEVEIDREDGNDTEHTYDVETGELVDKDD